MRIPMKDKNQLTVLGLLVGTYALLALLTYLIIPLDQLLAGQTMPSAFASVPPWVFGVANAVLVLILYGLVGLAGYWFSLRLGLPGVYRVTAGWTWWVVKPMTWGIAIGVFMIGSDAAIAAFGNGKGFPHPAFPLSLFASATAGIGEEILFRFLVMGLWAFLLTRIFKSPRGMTASLWIGNVIAALVFSASHVPAAMILLGIQSPADIPVSTIVELIVLNGAVGLAAGWAYIRHGLVAAIGVHFWADIVWHVIWPLFG
jgi:hypothetical protein